MEKFLTEPRGCLVSLTICKKLLPSYTFTCALEHKGLCLVLVLWFWQQWALVGREAFPSTAGHRQPSFLGEDDSTDCLEEDGFTRVEKRLQGFSGRTEKRRETKSFCFQAGCICDSSNSDKRTRHSIYQQDILLASEAHELPSVALVANHSHLRHSMCSCLPSSVMWTL